MMIAHGLQMQVMGIRSVLEDFNVLTTGIFMSGYYVGYFVGSQTTPNLVQKVGHIRVFAAFASLASLSALVAVAYVNPFMWTISRFITGISLVSCYVVSESWLNDRATNKNRGQLLSAYMIVLYLGLAIGMLLLNFSEPKAYEPFILVSVLLSLALVPILLTKRPAPKFKKIGTISVKELYRISPLGTVALLQQELYICSFLLFNICLFNLKQVLHFLKLQFFYLLLQFQVLLVKGQLDIFQMFTIEEK